MTLVLTKADGTALALRQDSISMTPQLSHLYAQVQSATGVIPSRITHLVTYKDDIRKADYNADRSTFYVFNHALHHILTTPNRQRPDSGRGLRALSTISSASAGAIKTADVILFVSFLLMAMLSCTFGWRCCCTKRSAS